MLILWFFIKTNDNFTSKPYNFHTINARVMSGMVQIKRLEKVNGE